MEMTIKNMGKRPFPLALMIILLLGAIGLMLAGGVYLTAGTDAAQMALLFTRLALRLTPPWVWLVAVTVPVFWLWLMRRLWREETQVNVQHRRNNRAAPGRGDFII